MPIRFISLVPSQICKNSKNLSKERFESSASNNLNENPKISLQGLEMWVLNSSDPLSDIIQVMEKIEQQTEITPAEQEAWMNMSNDLIFVEPTNTPLSKENIPQISEEIQKQFLDSLDQKQINMLEMITSTLNEMQINTSTESLNLIFDRKDDAPPRQALESFVTALSMDLADGSYYGWGFTPKLASENEYRMKPNCLGQAILIGAYCKKLGLKVEMGITPDHPFVITEIDGRKYIVRSSELTDISDEIEDKDDYSIYKPEKKTDDENSDDQIIIIHDFDQAVLHETLENIAVLEKIANKEPVPLLPGSRTEGERIAKEQKEALCATDWQTIQTKLFPTIQKSFKDTSDEWSNEIERIGKLRIKQYKGKILNTAFRQAFGLISQNVKEFEKIFPEIMISSRNYKDSIMGYLRHGTEFSDDVPENLRIFFKKVKEVIGNEEDGARTVLYNTIEQNLNRD